MLDMKKIIELINQLGIKVYTFDHSIFKNYLLGCWQWYKGDTPYHVRKFYNGATNVRQVKAKLHMAKRVSEDIASLVFNDNVKISIDSDSEREYLLGVDDMSGVLGDNDFWALMNKSCELMAGLGTVGLEVVAENLLQVDGKYVPTKNTKIKLARYDSLHLLPLSWTNTGKITELCLLDEYQVKNDTYLELRLHVLNEKGNYTIINKKCKLDYLNNSKTTNPFIYMLNDGVVEEFDTGSPIPWFTCIKMPQINSYDPNSPMGASAIGDCADELKAIDDGFNTLCGDFRNSNKTIYYSKSLLEKDQKGNVVLPNEDDSAREVYYYTGDSLNSNNDLKEPIKEFIPTIRSKEITDGIELVLDILSFKAGLGHGYYKFSNGSVQKTATEVISEHSDLYRNVCKMQLAIEKNIYELMRAFLYVSNYVFGTKYDVNCKMSVQFDQSLIEDKAAQRERALKEVQLGLLTPDEYRAIYYPELGDINNSDQNKDM